VISCLVTAFYLVVQKEREIVSLNIFNNGSSRSRILFAPLSGGFGHLNRCNALAEEIQRLDPTVETLFIAGGITYEAAQAVNFPVLKVPEAAPQSLLENWFKLASKGNASQRRLLTQSILLFVAFFLKGLQRWPKIWWLTKKFKPDIIVSDSEWWSIPISRINGIPCIFISNDVIPRFPVLLGKKWADSAQRVIDTWMTKLMKWTSLILVPDTPGSTRITQELKEKILFVGPILKKKLEELPDREMARKSLGLSPSDIMIFVTVTGIGVGSEHLYAAIKAFKHIKREEKNTKMIVKYWPAIRDKKSKKFKKIDGLKLVSFIPDIFEYMVASDILIANGGHVSMMEAALAGTAILIIPLPGHEEQFYNARRMKSEGRALMILPEELTTEKLALTVLSLIKDDQKRNNMIFTNRNQLGDSGTEKAAKIILANIRNVAS
jgi:UDP-N-acetylglucosamine--N-acetylmuramyl-(pentapeptide) pyrophosphoryl-undecaprenol N-acetylglucosamine transferase